MSVSALSVLKKSAVAMSVLSAAMPFYLCAQEIEFNSDILDVHDRENIDLSRFSRAGYVMPGRYVMTLRVNKDEIPEQNIEWVNPDHDEKDSLPCLTRPLVRTIGLKDSVWPQLTWFHQQQCLDLQSLPGSEAHGNPGQSVLYLNIPQAWLEYRVSGWDPPSRWENGIPGFLTDYYFSAQAQHQNMSGRSLDLSGYGTVGANTGAWRWRADWQTHVQRGGALQRHQRWDWSRYYIYRALPSLGAQLTLGEDALYSGIFDSFRFTGMSLRSDDRMLPPNLRGYAPEVTGVAKTNARVVISQQGRVLQEVQVAAGPFRIQDLNNAVSGKLDVRVEEQDGSVQRFTLNTASIPYLTRPGQVRYKLAAGQPSDMKHHIDGTPFATGEFSWGVSNGWSLLGGTVISPHYTALASGIGRDLMILGAMSFDITHSQATLPHYGRSLSGNAYRLSYSKRFDSTNSQVTFAGYRFSERNFMSMDEYLNARRYGIRQGNSKALYTITINQPLQDWKTSAFVNYSHQTYWNRPANDRYTLTLSRFFDVGSLRNLSLSMTAYRNRYLHNSDNGMYLSFSMPWGSTGTLGYSATLANGKNTHQVTYYDRSGDRDSYQLNSGISQHGGMIGGYWTHEGDLARTTANASWQAGCYSAVNLSIQGGITATSKGMALHRNSQQGGTRMFIDTNGVAGIPVKGFGRDTRSNHFGNAVISDISSYYRNRINVDLDALPDDAEVAHSTVQATLTEGAIGYRKLDVVSGARAMAILRLADGRSPPFGASVQNNQGQNTGIVGDDGSVYLSGIHPNDRIHVHWASKAQCTATLPAHLSTGLNQNLILPCQMENSHDQHTGNTP